MASDAGIVADREVGNARNARINTRCHADNARAIAHRQLDEVCNLGLDARVTFHIKDGIVRQVQLEAHMLKDGKQQFVLTPTLYGR